MKELTAEQRRIELRADVALMRELGVARWGEIILGPSPGAEHRDLTPEQVQERVAAQRQAQHDVLYAATGIRPRLVSAGIVPRAVPRANSSPEHARGRTSG